MKTSNPEWRIEFVEIASRRIRFAEFKLPKSNPRNVLFHINGRMEYIEKYEYLPYDLNLGPEFKYVTYDHPGQGQSEGIRAHIDSFEEYAVVAKAIANHTAKGCKVHILGHSMGSLIGLWSTLFGYLNPVSIHLLSPLISVYNPLLNDRLMLMVAQIGCKFKKKTSKVFGHNPSNPQSFEDNELTLNKEMFLRNLNSKYESSPITYGWLRAVEEAIFQINRPENFKPINSRIYLTASSIDKLVSTRKTLAWAQMAQRNGLDTDAVVLHGKHELLAEKEPTYSELLSRIRNIVRNTQNEYPN